MLFILFRCFWLIYFTKVLIITAEIEIRGFNFLRDFKFDNMILNHGVLWELNTSTTVACAIHCTNDIACISLHFHKQFRQCRGYETLMLTPLAAGKNETKWMYFYLTKPGACSPEYAYTRVFDFCLSFKGIFTDDVGEAKCQEDNARYMLIQSAEENRFASLLAYNYASSIDLFLRQMRIQGTFNDITMTWQDDSGQNLSFTQFIAGKEIPNNSNAAIFIKPRNDPENYPMTSRLGNRNPSMIVCVI